MPRRIALHLLSLLLLSVVAAAHSNPEIVSFQEQKALEQFNASPSELGASVRSTDVLVRSEAVGHAIRKPLASPDGKWIAFTSSEQDVLCVFETASTEVKTVASGPGVGTDYAWSRAAGELL